MVSITMLALMGCPPQQTPAPEDVDEPAVETPDEPEEPVEPDAPVDPVTRVDVDDDGNTIIMESPDGETQIHVSPDGSSTSITGDGTVVTIGQNQLPEGWPEFVPLMEGFTIVSSEILPEGQGMYVATEGLTPVDDVSAFYQALPDFETILNQDLSQEDTQVAIISMQKGEDMLTVQIISDLEKGVTVLQLSFNPGSPE